jgi:hypothetical protein
MSGAKPRAPVSLDDPAACRSSYVVTVSMRRKCEIPLKVTHASQALSSLR